MAEMDDARAASRPDSGDIVAKLKALMIDHSLPLWSGEGWDQTAGGFIDRLHPDGRADRLAPRRVFVQSPADLLLRDGCGDRLVSGGRAIALRGLDYLLGEGEEPRWPAGFCSHADA